MSAINPSSARLLIDEAEAAAAATRRRARATSTPLIVMGVLGAVVAADQWVTGDFFSPVFLTGPVTVLILVVLAWRERRRRIRTGLSAVSGYGVGGVAILAVGVFLVPLLLIGLAGPYLGLAAVVVILGWRDHRRRLVIWTVVLAAAGTAESFYALTNRLSYHAWNESLHYAILVTVGLLFLGAGLVERRRENRP